MAKEWGDEKDQKELETRLAQYQAEEDLKSLQEKQAIDSWKQTRSN